MPSITIDGYNYAVSPSFKDFGTLRKDLIELQRLGVITIEHVGYCDNAHGVFTVKMKNEQTVEFAVDCMYITTTCEKQMKTQQRGWVTIDDVVQFAKEQFGL